ncbi:aminoglycoside phosphotransferase family protein [Streptomyces sp. CBMA156]|uniref:aminoglycoside phosphotransferase family protein n=1 Tax=Streptomyces sp. CBMA156 TaxID=1930280 RepID=UPI0016621B76|nr:aminoglycoside phosphotransferase family protein [Streptomyces sp. CBMA156]MBD0676669.1 kinase [Streptomyces sp. CBMA156]
MIAIPDGLVRTTVDREGAPGAAWIAELPGLAAELLEHWGCVPDGVATHGGVGLVLPVRPGTGHPAGRTAGRTAVLKVSFPHPGNVHEPDAFAVWAGRGAVRLYERDVERFAMLLERVSPATLAEVRDSDEVVTVAGRLSRRLAVPAPPRPPGCPPGLPRLSDRAPDWETRLRADAASLPHALPARTVAAALATVRDLARAQPDLLVHGDLHARNILRAEREPWLAVDPKGYLGDPAYDGGTLLTAHALTLLDAADVRRAILRALDAFAEAAELDRERTRRWAQLHAVQAAFRGRRHGFRRARSGPERDRLTRYADQLAEVLTSG